MNWQGFKSHVSHLECSATGERYRAGIPHGVSRAGKPLIVRYDLPAVAASVTREEIVRRSPDLWRYRELLPVPSAEHMVSLGEAFTALVSLDATARRAGGENLMVKDEGRLPTGSCRRSEAAAPHLPPIADGRAWKRACSVRTTRPR